MKKKGVPFYPGTWKVNLEGEWTYAEVYRSFSGELWATINYLRYHLKSQCIVEWGECVGTPGGMME